MILTLIACATSETITPTPAAIQLQIATPTEITLPTITPAPNPTGTPTPQFTSTATQQPTATSTLPPAPTETSLSAETSTEASTEPATETEPEPGFVTGEVCYPGSETPPLTLTIENLATGETTNLDVERGQTVFNLELPTGDYIAYARTVGMNLHTAFTCDDQEPCPFHVASGQTTSVDLCGWYAEPGVQPALATQPANEVQVRLLQNMNARTGPHLSYPELGLVESSVTVKALKRSADGEWLLVKHPDYEQTGWLHAPLTQVFGDPGALPIEPADSLPKFEFEQFAPASWHTESNPGIVLFKGEIKDQHGRPVNGYSVLLDNGTWSVLSHPTGASRHYPDVQDGQWDVIIENETDAAGWWTMTVIRYECPDFETGFNAQCKQFTPLSETKVVKVVHPDENIIEANWTCLERCDEGLYTEPFRVPK